MNDSFELAPGQIYASDANQVCIIMKTHQGLKPFWLANMLDGSDNFVEIINVPTGNYSLVTTIDGRLLKKLILQSVGKDFDYE